MRRYRLSPAAQADIDAIWDYTAENWSVDQANSYTREIRDACGAIAQGQRTGRSASDHREGYLKLTVRSHVIFYVVRDDVVDVIRILHQRMDFGRHLDVRV